MNPDIIKTYPFIDRWRSTGYQYYQIPRSMLAYGGAFDLGLDEIMLYAVLKARTSLSCKNNWVDPVTKQVYIIYKRETAAAYFDWSLRKTTQVFKRLVDAGLLREQEQPSAKKTLKKPKRLFLNQWAEPTALVSVQELKNGGFWPITQDTCGQAGGYYIIPYSFFEDDALRGLKLRSILLYAILLDKLHKSLTYGYVDQQGKVYCKADTNDLMEQLGCSHGSLSDSYSELQKAQLLVKIKDGYAGDFRLYLRDYMPTPETDATQPVPPDDEGCPAPPPNDAAVAESAYFQNLRPEQPKNDCDTTLTSKFCAPYFQNLRVMPPNSSLPNDQNLRPNYPSYSTVSPSRSLINIGCPDGEPDVPVKKQVYSLAQLDETTLLGVYQDQVLYPALCQDIALLVEDEEQQENWMQTLDALLQMMVKDTLTPGAYIRFGATVVEKNQVLEEYKKINRFIMLRLLTALSNANDVQNRNAYLHKSLYSAVAYHEGAAYYMEREIENRRANQQAQQAARTLLKERNGASCALEFFSAQN